MLYVHYCQNCQSIHLLNGHKNICPSCAAHLYEIKLSFLEYTKMTAEKRGDLLKKLYETYST